MDCDYHIKWSPYKNSVIDLYQNFFSAGTLTDITLTCEGQKIRAHKLVLSVMSSYFKNIISQHQDDTLIIEMHNMNYDDLKSVIQYMYSGELYVLNGRFLQTKEILGSLQVRGFVDMNEKIRNFSSQSSGSTVLEPQTIENVDFIHQPENHSEISEPQSQETVRLLQPRIAPFQQRMQEFREKKLESTTSEMQSLPSVTAPKPQKRLFKPKAVTPMERANSSTSLSPDACSSKKSGASKSPIRDGTIDVTKQCIFCEGHSQGKMILVGEKGREILKDETRDNSDGIYQKLLDYEEIYIHGKCKRSYNTPRPCHKKPVKSPSDYCCIFP